MSAELTSVTDTSVVIHDGTTVHQFDELTPDHGYSFRGVEAHTLPRPGGELLCRFATVNDVHFGELECGRVDDDPNGPILRAPAGSPPYPFTMNRGAVAEIVAIDPIAVIAKGDLTSDGTDEQYAAFCDCYGDAFGDRLHHVRGNHDAYHFQTYAAGDRRIDLPGVVVALLDTTIPGATTGRFTAGQATWLSDVASHADRPVLVMGHHQNWTGGRRGDDYFGISPDDSERLIDVVARHRSIAGYFAGHTHRNRVRHVASTGDVPYVEVACVKDYPGSWAEYRVYDNAIMQIHHRISTPDALAWSEQCRWLYRDFGIDYQSYARGRIEDRCFVLAKRDRT